MLWSKPYLHKLGKKYFDRELSRILEKLPRAHLRDSPIDLELERFNGGTREILMREYQEFDQARRVDTANENKQGLFWEVFPHVTKTIPHCYQKSYILPIFTIARVQIRYKRHFPVQNTAFTSTPISENNSNTYSYGDNIPREEWVVSREKGRRKVVHVNRALSTPGMNRHKDRCISLIFIHCNGRESHNWYQKARLPDLPLTLPWKFGKYPYFPSMHLHYTVMNTQ